MKTKLLALTIGLFIIIPLVSFANSNLTDRLSGRILLQVEEKGEAWYINPANKNRYFLGRPDDAFKIMRELGLGIAEKDFNSFKNKVPQRLSGKILLRVEANGEAYYVNPTDLRMHFLGRPADAFTVMRNLGLGITNKDLNNIKKYGAEKEEVNNKESCIDINTASKDDLKKIIHIDDERADDLIRLRPFESLDNLSRITGIASVRINDIKNEGLACVVKN
jgi:hypothetical protein